MHTKNGNVAVPKAQNQPLSRNDLFQQECKFNNTHGAAHTAHNIYCNAIFVNIPYHIKVTSIYNGIKPYPPIAT